MTWKPIKLAILVLAFLSGLTSNPIDPTGSSQNGAVLLAVSFFSSTLIVLIIFGLQFRFNSKVRLSRPRFEALPFSVRYPSSLVQFAAYLGIASGIGSATIHVVKGSDLSRLAAASANIGFGLGALLGLHLLLWLLKERIELESPEVARRASRFSRIHALVVAAVIVMVFVINFAQSQTESFAVGKAFVQSSSILGARANKFMTPLGSSWSGDRMRYTYLSIGTAGFAKGSIRLMQAHGKWVVVEAYGRNETGETVSTKPSY